MSKGIAVPVLLDGKYFPNIKSALVKIGMLTGKKRTENSHMKFYEAIEKMGYAKAGKHIIVKIEGMQTYVKK